MKDGIPRMEFTLESERNAASSTLLTKLVLWCSAILYSRIFADEMTYFVKEVVCLEESIPTRNFKVTPAKRSGADT